MALGGAEFTPVAICGREEGELCIMPEKVLVLWSDSEVCRGLEVVVVMMVVGVECAGVELMVGRTGVGSAEVLMDVGWGVGALPLVFKPAKLRLFICWLLVYMLMVGLALAGIWELKPPEPATPIPPCCSWIGFCWEGGWTLEGGWGMEFSSVLRRDVSPFSSAIRTSSGRSFNSSPMSGASLAEESIFCRLVGGIPPGPFIMVAQIHTGRTAGGLHSYTPQD